MSAKEVKFAHDAREKMLRGVDILADAVKVDLAVAVGGDCAHLGGLVVGGHLPAAPAMDY